MAIICWGNLAKSADDTARIEQSMQDYVEGHNENENAHQIEGSSLYMHRVNEKLDHIDGSIDLKKLAKDSRLAIGMFESLDGWTKHGTCSPNIFGARISSDGGAGSDEGWMTASPYTGEIDNQFTKNPFFQTTVRMTTTTDQELYFGVGALFGEAGGDGFGFRIVNSTLYAYWESGGVAHSQEIAGVTINAFVCYRAIMDSVNQTIEYYVNGVLKYTQTTNLPSVSGGVYFEYYIKKTGATVRYLYPVDLIMQTDR